MEMLAAFREKYISPEQLKLKKIPIPAPGRDDLLIRMHFGSVNRTDDGFLRGKPSFARLLMGWPRPRQKVLGNEFAGKVVQVGANVSSFQEGDRVFGFDDRNFGGHAEYKQMGKTGAIAKIPDALSFREAAALTEGGHYALSDIRAVPLEKGDRVLVNGTTGAIGSAAIQLLLHMGMQVTAVCGSAHQKLMREWGADEVFDYTKGDFADLAEKGAYDWVFDAVGKSRWRKCRPLLKRKGIYISTELGPNNENPFLALLGVFKSGKRVKFPIPSVNAADVAWLGRLAAEGHFVPLIDSVFPFQEIVRAYERVETGEKVGNVLLKMPI